MLDKAWLKELTNRDLSHRLSLRSTDSVVVCISLEASRAHAEAI